MKFRIKALSLIFLLTAINQTAFAELKAINDTAKQWNQFVDNLLTLSNQLTKATPHSEKWRIGGYSNEPGFYDEIKYFDQQTGLLTSTVQWERANPEAVHSIEVFLRDKKNRVIKDFSASYLTKHRNAPIQTLITLHYYNKNLHGFRVFDASLNRIYEVCRGTLNGKKINIDLDDDYGELSEALENKKGIMSSVAYKTCFGGRNVDKSQLNIPLN